MLIFKTSWAGACLHWAKVLTRFWKRVRIFRQLCVKRFCHSLRKLDKFFQIYFFDISQTRRTLILPMLSKSLKDVVETTVPGVYLFGNELAEKVKEAKTLERTANDLRPQTQSSTFSASKKGGGVATGRSQTSRPYTSRGGSSGPLNRGRPVRPSGKRDHTKGMPRHGGVNTLIRSADFRG